MHASNELAIPLYSIQSTSTKSYVNYYIKDNNKIKEINQNAKPITYQIKISYHFMKCPIFTFSNEDNILYTAKHQYNEIIIGKGYEVHINKDSSNHIGKILQEHDRINSILEKGKRFNVKFVELEKPNHFSLSVTFPNKGRNVTWAPKKFDNKKTPNKRSKKDCVLANSDGQTVFIFKKKSNDLFQIQTIQSIDPLIIFAIGLSAIIGPHDGPFGGF